MSKRSPGKPIGRDDLISRVVGDEVFLYDPVTDEVALFNESAAVIFDLCDGSRTEVEISVEMGRLFEAAGERLEQDVRQTLAEFSNRGLIVWE